MNRRLYFVLPDVQSAERTLDDLLLARVEVRRIHCLARRDIDLGKLPEATFLQKTDTVHGAESGMAIGGLAGVIGGAVAVFFPPAGASLQLVTLLVTGFIGAVFGMWVASMVGTAVPNSKLARFWDDIDRGKILMMVDVPFIRSREVTELVARRHPEALAGGVEPSIPAFP
ncbi:MAG TPA: DUF1269 domain-containing protein [Burkholderiales bacterium]|nr:DUF1269 domain-containing protein [Burkholderiales bacterium]